MRKAIMPLVLIAAMVAPAAAGFFDAIVGAISWTAELAVILAEKQPRLKEMYLGHFGPNGPAGTLHPSLTVVEGGKVTDVVIQTDTIGDDAFAEAIRAEVLTWRMPDSAANMELGFDLEFDPARGLYGVDAKKTD